MSYSDDLDWLARNVREWPDNAKFAALFGGSEPVFYEHFYKNIDQFSRDDVQSRRAELQNKPSWESAPEWGRWLAQDKSGAWWFFRFHPEAISEVWDCDGSAYHHSSWIDGEVLSDWRDTLEQRPKEFQLFTSIEDNHEKVMKHDNRWYERGELPPVGTKCEYRLSTTSPWYPCEIKYVIHDDGVVMMREDGFEQFCSINSKLQPVSFRPIRTDRDEAIEAMKAHCPYPGSWETTYRLFAESLYDAGYRAGGSE